MATTEAYLSQLDREIAEKERRLELLRSWCGEEERKINVKRTERREVEESFAVFLEQQKEFFDEEMRKASRNAEEFLKTRKIEVEELVKRESIVEREKEDLSKEKEELAKRKIQVEEDQERVSKEMVVAAEELDKALSLKRTALWDKKDVMDARIKYASLSKKLKRSIEEWVTFESEKRKVLEEKEAYLEKEIAITLAERKRYFESYSQLDADRRKVADQWEQLLLAKAFLDGKLTQRQQPSNSTDGGIL